MLAVDQVMGGATRDTIMKQPSSDGVMDTSDPSAETPLSRAFVLGRPPGHHAGPNGYGNLYCLFVLN